MLKRKLMLIFVDETDTLDEMPLYEAIVRRLSHSEIAGATVHRGIMGYGSQGKVHHKRLFGISDDRPITILVVDTEEKIHRAAVDIRPMVSEGLVLLLDVDLIQG